MSCAATRRRAARAPAAGWSVPPEMVDVAFDIEAADPLPADFEWPLYRAVARLVPWLDDCGHGGIHPLRGARTGDGGLLLARRAKLVVRMPRDRVCAASVLERSSLAAGTGRIVLGSGTFRKLRPAPTLYSPRVAVDESDEQAFTRRLGEELARLEIRRPFICGRRATVTMGRKAHTTFSVAVHDLDEAQSILLQRAGLGQARAVGCGLFIPHRNITAAP